MSLSNRIKNQHLLSRAGFGVSIDDIPHLDKNNNKFLKEIIKASQDTIQPLEVQDPFVENTLKSMNPDERGDMSKEMFSEMNKPKGKAIRMQSGKDIQQLSIDWMHEMVYSKAILREKIALFWHGHFACNVNNSMYEEELLSIIRNNALGDFRILLKEVSKSSAMILFLNNQQNSKKHPNENFGREVMELFTLGRGNYTENDVKEIARAFTGWQVKTGAGFFFNEKIHDTGNKTFLGETGNFNGDDAIDIILKQKQTAVFISQRLYRFFVNENIDASAIQWLSDRFYKNDYNISLLMEDIFSSDWFYNESNIGIQIKSPVVYIGGIRRFLPMTLQNEEVQIVLERLLGQWLFNPPNVAGWAGEKAWIDSSSLMLRLKIPSLIKNDETLDLKPKTDDDVQMGQKEYLQIGPKKKKSGGYQILASVDWSKLLKAIGEKDKTAVLQKMKSLLIQTPDNKIDDAVIMGDKTDEDLIQFTRRITIELMSTPEYQLC
ncbi:DUF1800 domain-containing protein [Taibaiella lutea]|uniref:DUF1800 domain-containing protein n=1 Tax=Taibaiella lutea TaxID=2608001 RepID=A0A5M6CB74_9BACT|nr:DUF1800 domain-containing protein [Taibaiella lutea]KAA5532426.1 DUF1800 domain-containing protein [Taibaiella lutea]